MRTKTTVKKEAIARRIVYLLLMITSFALVYESRLRIVILGERFISPNIYAQYAGVIINLLGIGLAIDARWKLGENWSGRVTVKKDHILVQTGPYALTRHPIYKGIFFWVSWSCDRPERNTGLDCPPLLFIALHIKIVQEEKFMKQLFPSYIQYAKKTKKLIPLLY